MPMTLNRIRQPLFAERVETIPLREAVGARERRRYFAELKRLRRQIGRLDRQYQAALKRMLTDARRGIVTAIGDSRGFSAYHVRELSGSFQEVMDTFASRYLALMDEALAAHGDLGIKMTLDLMTASQPDLFGPGLAGITSLSPDVLEAAAMMSADLISNITATALAGINREVRFVSMGLKSPYQAIGAIGRNLDDPSVFGSIATRAETILRTESGRIRSQATLAAQERIKDVALPAGMKVKKQWLWSGIGREEHAVLDGEQVAIGADFTDGFGNSGQAPRMFGAPESDLNCGCEAITVVVEEA